jgi:hypothetical protein
MKPILLLGLALVLSGGFAVVRADGAVTNSPLNIKIIEPSKNITIWLVVPGSDSLHIKSQTVDITAKEIFYNFVPKPDSGLARFLPKAASLEIHDPYARKICFIDPDHSFYISDSLGFNGYTVGPGGLIWSDSYLELPDSVNEGYAISQFEKNFDAQKFNQEWKNRDVNRIGLGQVVPQFYFSDGPNPGGGTPLPKVESVDLADGVLHLDIRNPVTKIPASFWMDLKAKKVIKSVVDGQEMDLSAVGTDKNYAVPLKKNWRP